MSKPLEDVWAWLKGQVNSNALMLAVLGFVVLISGAWGRAAVVELMDERTQALREEQARQRAAMARYESDVHEFAKDLRELYRVTPWVRPSERLERPFPEHRDGGP